MATISLAREEDRLLLELADLYEVWVNACRHFYPGRLRWRTINGTDYLLRIPKGHSNGISLGPRSPDLERLFDESAESEARAKTTWERLQLKGRMLKAARVPMITDIAGESLRSLDIAGLLGEHMRVVGSTAIPAYEIAAGVKFDPLLHATEDVDLTWVGTEIPYAIGTPVLTALKHGDSTWTVNQERPFQLRNRHGDILDVLVAPSVAHTFPRREAIRAVDMPGQEDLMGGTPLERVVLDMDGLPARVVAPDPRLFALHKLALSHEDGRRREKRSKDLKQAHAVLEWIRDRMPEYPLDEDFRSNLSPRLQIEWDKAVSSRLIPPHKHRGHALR